MAFSTHDIVSDSPTNNFATLNPLDATSTITFDKGNLNCIHSQNVWGNVRGSMGFNSGRYYWEAKQTVASSTFFGFSDDFYIYTNDSNASNSNCDLLTSWKNNGGLNTDISITVSWGGGGYSTTDILMICVDYDLGYVWLGKNGSWLLSGDPDNNSNPVHTFSNSTKEKIYPYIALSDGGGIYVHFGQDPTFGGNASPSTTYPGARGIGAFYYQPPTGAKALCTANLPDLTPTVTGDVPQEYFKAVTYTGNGTGQSITGVGFQPDLVWAKRRDTSAAHVLADSVRGARQMLSPNASTENLSEGSGKTLLSFDSGGFTVGTDGDYYTSFTASGSSIVAWCWKAGGAPTADNTATSGAMNANGSAATSSNSSVSINGVLQSNYTPAGSPTIYPKRMSINTDAGFSIVKYVGDGSTNNSSPATVPSGLSDVDVVLVKNLDYGSHPNQANNVCNWQVYHKSLSSNHNLLLDVANAEYDITASGAGGIQINNGNLQLITRTVSQTWNANVNDSGDNYIAYCWHSVEGYSKFGSYTGNGSADGPFVYTGFRPAFVICKCSSDTTTTNTSWAMYDNARDSSNVMNKVLYVNQNIKEGYRGDASTAATDIYIDFLSNGFKVRSTKEEVNDSGETYIFMAFAEQPFKFSNAR